MYLDKLDLLIEKKESSLLSTDLFRMMLSGSVLLVSRFIDPSMLPPICPFRFLTGIPCMFCGLTNAFHAISLGNFSQAAAFHPLSLFAYGLVIFHLVTASARVLRLKFGRIFPKLSILNMAWLTFSLFTLVWLVKLSGIL